MGNPFIPSSFSSLSISFRSLVYILSGMLEVLPSPSSSPSFFEYLPRSLEEFDRVWGKGVLYRNLWDTIHLDLYIIYSRA